MSKKDTSKLVMRVNSPRYRTPCATCKGRVRIGRVFLVDPEDPGKIHHEGCYSLAKRRRGN